MGDGPPVDYSLAGSNLVFSNQCAVRDLGVFIDPTLSFTPHVESVVARARRVAGLILRSFRSSSATVLARAFTCYARPILEFCSPVVNAMSAKDSARIESVLRWFSLRVCKRLNISCGVYSDRLAALGLDSLELRRSRLDLGFVHAIAHNKHYCPQLALSATSVRYPLSHGSRLISDPKAKGIRRRLALNRIAPAWNALPPAVTKLSRPAFAQRLKDPPLG
jgi:hypothetical protein